MVIFLVICLMIAVAILIIGMASTIDKRDKEIAHLNDLNDTWVQWVRATSKKDPIDALEEIRRVAKDERVQ